MEFKYLKSDNIKDNEKIDSYIEELENPLPTKSRLKDLKSYISRNFEDALAKFISEPYLYCGKYKEIPEEILDLDIGLTQLHHAEGKIKKIDKLIKNGIEHEVLDISKAILEEASQLNRIIKSATIATKEEKKEPSPQDIISANIHNQAFNFLNTEVKKLEPSLKENLLQQLNKETQKRIEHYAGNPLYIPLVTKLRDDLKVKNPKLASQDSELIVLSFVSKNITKISPVIKEREIIEAKGHFSLSGANIEGFLSIKLEDNSSFKVSMNSEFAYSKNNTLFMRFPTRFHDAFDSENNKITNPSQNKLSNKL